MFDFLLTHNHTNNPTALGILITVLCSFFLASLVALTYELTTPKVQKSKPLLQSMVLLAIVSAMVMQAIGDSLARGLGMLGALAIIRFRTKLDNPRNMAFIFAALANGIACGVYGFTIAFIGTAGFCISAFILKHATFGTEPIHIGVLRFESAINADVNSQVESLMAKYCDSYKLKTKRFENFNRIKTVKNADGAVVEEIKLDLSKEYEYIIKITSDKGSNELAKQLEQMPDIKEVRLRFGNQADML